MLGSWSSPGPRIIATFESNSPERTACSHARPKSKEYEKSRELDLEDLKLVDCGVASCFKSTQYYSTTLISLHIVAMLIA